jgi:hypothetical protein
MMARFKTQQAFYADAVGVGRVRAGRTVADSQANALPGDVIWSGLNSQRLPAGFVPLDQAAIDMKAASVWANEPAATVILGVHSIDG